MVTPLRLRAVTSRPRGKWRSIFLTGGVVRNFLRASLSSTVVGEVLIFLVEISDVGNVSSHYCYLPARFLGLLSNLKLNSLRLCTNCQQLI